MKSRKTLTLGTIVLASAIGLAGCGKGDVDELRLGKHKIGYAKQTILPYTEEKINYYKMSKVILEGNSWRPQNPIEKLKGRFTHYEVLVEEFESGKRVLIHDYLPKEWVEE